MPGGAIGGQVAKASAKELAKKGIKSLINIALRSAVKSQSRQFARNAMDRDIGKDTQSLELTKKGDLLLKAYEKEADKPVTGLPFSLAVAQVFTEANAFSTLDGNALLDTLMEMIPIIDLKVDRKYQRYLEKVNRSADTAVLNFMSTAAGVAEGWYECVSWTNTYKNLRTKLRSKLQAKEDRQKALVKKLIGLEAQNTQLIGQLERAISELKVMIGKFVKVDRRADNIEIELSKTSKVLTASSNNFDMVMGQYERLLEKGLATWQGKIYHRKDREALQNVLWGYEKKKKAAQARHDKLDTRHDKLENWEDAYEKHLYRKLADIRELHWKLWTVREELNLQNGRKPDRKAKVPRLEIPWRMGDGYPKLRTECYPFTLRVPKTHNSVHR